MKTKIDRFYIQGMTLIEVLVVILVLIILASMIIPPAGPNPRKKAIRISCVNNLKQVGTAYRIWENDHGDKYPMGQTEALGGMADLLSNTPDAGRYTYLVYSIMQNEMGQSPRVLLCPADERTANTNFYYGLRNAPTDLAFKSLASGKVGSFDNTNVSYFWGAGSDDRAPQSILGGDRNLGDGGFVNPKTGEVISPEQDPNYGISGFTANPDYPCGADAIINTNGQWESAFIAGGGGNVRRGSLVAWSAKMHSVGNLAGAGNILLGDGSAQQCTSAGLRQNWIRNAISDGNFSTNDKIHSANRGDIRLLFP